MPPFDSKRLIKVELLFDMDDHGSVVFLQVVRRCQTELVLRWKLGIEECV